MRDLVIRTLVVRVVVSCAVGATALVASSVLGTPALVQAPSVSPGPTTGTRSAQGADRVSSLLARHHCWTGEAPAGAPDPGHAVVTIHGGRPHLVDAAVGFGIWLEGDPGVLHGFCP